MGQHILYRVEIKGQESTDVAKLFINQSINGHHEFQLELATDYTGSNASKFDDARKMIGSTILVEFESKLEKSEKSQFKGIITNVGLSQQDSSTSQIIVKGFSPTIMMDGLKNSKSFFEKSLSDNFKEIVKQQPSNVLGSSNNSSVTTKVPYTLQIQESDYNFLARQAEKHGEWFYYDGNELNLGMSSNSKEHKLEIGGHISDVEIHMNTEPLGQSFATYDYRRDAVDSNDIKGNLGAKGRISEACDYSNKIFSTKAQDFNRDISTSGKGATELVKSKAAVHSAGLMTVSGSTAHPGLKIGDVVEITTSKESYGKFIIIELSHSLVGTSQYQNHFTAISSDVKGPPVNHNVVEPTMHSTFAKVIDNADPDKLGRVKVQFYWANSEVESDWIRVIHSSAGKNYGNYFVPEIEDQVLIDFEFGNPDLPYAAGAAFHKKNEPADFFDDKNYIKAIVTKGDNKILINDEPGKEKIEIFSPKEKHKIVLDVSKKVLEIESKGDIKIKGKNISLDASDTIDLKCKTLNQKADKASSLESLDVNIKASKGVAIQANATVELKSSGKASLSGSATTEVQSAGIVQVKGSLVKIN